MEKKEAIELMQEWRNEIFKWNAVDPACGDVMDENAENAVEVYDIALQSLRADMERENPTALTLDQLRGMDGKPVWVKMGCGGRWRVLAKYLDSRCEKSKRFLFTDNEVLFVCTHGIDWTTYPHEPKLTEKEGEE